MPWERFFFSFLEQPIQIASVVLTMQKYFYDTKFVRALILNNGHLPYVNVILWFYKI